MLLSYVSDADYLTEIWMMPQHATHMYGMGIGTGVYFATGSCFDLVEM